MPPSLCLPVPGVILHNHTAPASSSITEAEEEATETEEVEPMWANTSTGNPEQGSAWKRIKSCRKGSDFPFLLLRWD